MDHSAFFVHRIKYIRYFYSGAVRAFREQKHAIENELEPYDCPPYSEDGEPPFLSEWIDADQSEEVLGQTCISMLSNALKVYLNATREDDLEFVFVDPKILKKGFVRPHIEGFCARLKIDLQDCPVDIDLIEQVALARNNIQHSIDLISLDIEHDDQTLKRYSDPFFAHSSDKVRDQTLGRSWYSTRLSVTQDKLFDALDECLKLAHWLGPETWGPEWAERMEW